MVQLQIQQKMRWLRLHKRRQKWQVKHPGKFLSTHDPIETEISRYICALCGERKYYYTNRTDKDIPQYHKVGKRWLTLCHACWHLKGIYKKHQDAHSPEGLSGCRFCGLQLAAKLAKQRSQNGRRAADKVDAAGSGQVESSTIDWQPTGVRGGNGLSEGRERSRNVQRKRPTGRRAR